MRCFIHNEAEAIATCKKCGKAMCAKCSAYSKHSGICPECRCKEFEDEVERNNNKIKELKWERVKNIFFMIILCWTIIAIFINLYRFIKNGNEITSLLERNEKLTIEINKLTKALNERGNVSFE